MQTVTGTSVGMDGRDACIVAACLTAYGAILGILNRIHANASARLERLRRLNAALRSHEELLNSFEQRFLLMPPAREETPRAASERLNSPPPVSASRRARRG